MLLVRLWPASRRAKRFDATLETTCMSPRLPLIALALALAGCSASQIYEPASPQGDAPTQQTVTDQMAKIFSPSADPRDILVSPATAAVEQGLFVWLVCVRAHVKGMSGEDVGIQTTAVFFQKREMILRRRAEPHDKCEKFEPINTSSAKLK